MFTIHSGNAARPSVGDERLSTCRGWQLLVMLDGAIPATRKALNRAGLSIDNIDDIDDLEVTRSVGPRPAGIGARVQGRPGQLNPAGGALKLGTRPGPLARASWVPWSATSKGLAAVTAFRPCEAGMANATIIEVLA